MDDHSVGERPPLPDPPPVPLPWRSPAVGWYSACAVAFVGFGTQSGEVVSAAGALVAAWGLGYGCDIRGATDRLARSWMVAILRPISGLRIGDRAYARFLACIATVIGVGLVIVGIRFAVTGWPSVE